MRVREESGDIVVVAASVQDLHGANPVGAPNPDRSAGAVGAPNPDRSAGAVGAPNPDRSAGAWCACEKQRMHVSPRVSACALSSPDSARAHARALRVSSRRV